MLFYMNVFEGPQANMHTTHIQEGIIWRTLDVRGSWNESRDTEIVMNTYNYPSF